MWRSPEAVGPPSWLVSTAWDKAAGTAQIDRTGLLGVPSFSVSVKGQPAMWVPAAISQDGGASAVLVEPALDEAHLNNRSAKLLVYSSEPSYTLTIDGLGPTDPQVRSLCLPSHLGVPAGMMTMSLAAGFPIFRRLSRSALPRTGRKTYTIGAIMVTNPSTPAATCWCHRPSIYLASTP